MHLNQREYEHDYQTDKLNFQQKYVYLIPAEVQREHEPALQKMVQSSVPALAFLGSP